jgi:hypothetical protein
MAILVMSVGVLAVMSLFPIAFLRSAQATQLTNATILKMRAEALVDMFGLASDAFIPQPAEGHVTRCLIDPIGWQDVAASLDLQPQQGFRFWNAHQYGVDGNLQRARYRPSMSPFGFQPEPPTVFVSVPLDGPLKPLRRLGLATGPQISSFAPLPPYPFNPLRSALFPSRQAALGAVALPDTLETQFTATPAANTLLAATFDPEQVALEDLVALQAILATPTLGMRLVLVGENGKQSQIRIPTAIDANGRSITWGVPLPNTANYQTLSEVRVETPDPRYTWMLTVRKRGISGGSSTEIDCVVFFNRAADDPEEELVHTAAIPGPANIPIAPEDAAYTGTVTFTAYPSDPQRVPPLKRGGFVFDPTHAQWYRVQEILVEGPTAAVIRLDRQPRQFITTLVAPRGVVQVFPLKTRVDEGRTGL